MTNLRSGNFFIPFLIGGVLGSTAALLFTPASGRENRDLITGNINLLLSRADEKKRLLIKRAQKFSDNLVSAAEGIYNKSTRQAAGKFTSSNDSILLEIKSFRNAINAAINTFKKKQENTLNKNRPEKTTEEEKYGVFEYEALPKHEGMKRRNQ